MNSEGNQGPYHAVRIITVDISICIFTVDGDRDCHRISRSGLGVEVVYAGRAALKGVVVIGYEPELGVIGFTRHKEAFEPLRTSRIAEIPRSKGGIMRIFRHLDRTGDSAVVPRDGRSIGRRNRLDQHGIIFRCIRISITVERDGGGVGGDAALGDTGNGCSLIMRMVRIIRAGEGRRGRGVVLSPCPRRLAPGVAGDGDRLRRGLDCERGVRKRSGGPGLDTLCRTGGGSGHRAGSRNRLGLNVACVTGADSRRGDAAIPFGPHVSRLAPVMGVIPLRVYRGVGSNWCLEVEFRRKILVRIPAAECVTAFLGRRLRLRGSPAVGHILRVDLVASIRLECYSVLCNGGELRHVGYGAGHGRESIVRAVDSGAAVRRPAAEGVGVQLGFSPRGRLAAVDGDFACRILYCGIIDAIADELDDVFEVENSCLLKQADLSGAAAARVKTEGAAAVGQIIGSAVVY